MNLEALTYTGLIYDLKNTVSLGRTTKDFNISDDQLGSWIIDKRYKYLSQDISKGKLPDLMFVQTLPCIDLVPTDRSLCCSIDIGCTFLKSVEMLPDLIHINRFGPIDLMAKKWDIISHDMVALQKYAPAFTKKKPSGFFWDIDNYLGIFYDPDFSPESKYLSTVSLSGVLTDPREAARFNNCNTGLPCWGPDEPFPITKKMWEQIRLDILKNELGITLSTTEDTTNNSKSDPVQPQTKR